MTAHFCMLAVKDTIPIRDVLFRSKKTVGVSVRNCDCTNDITTYAQIVY